MKDYEQLYYDLLYELKKANKKIKSLEEEIKILTSNKEMKIKQIIINQLSNSKEK
ncbi:MAG: hypothetical protein MR779_04615 [Tenericutes bacterium]|nr:hypothetical protein [Mycoplasmatota bacterium]